MGLVKISEASSTSDESGRCYKSKAISIDREALVPVYSFTVVTLLEDAVDSVCDALLDVSAAFVFLFAALQNIV